MKRLIAILFLALCSEGFCFSPLETLKDAYNTVFTDDYEDWTVKDSVWFSTDGEHWMNISKGIKEYPATEKFYLKIFTQVITDYSFQDSWDEQTVYLKIKSENGIDDVKTKSGNGDFSWTKDKQGFEGVYEYNVICRNSSASESFVQIIEFKNIKPGDISLEVIFQNETLRKMTKERTFSVTIKENVFFQKTDYQDNEDDN